MKETSLGLGAKLLTLGRELSFPPSAPDNSFHSPPPQGK